MRFAKIVFWIAGIYGVLVIAPLFFLFDLIGKNDPPPITHPGFYYGFTCVTIAWQIAFIVIARDPIRLRPMMIPAILEKFAYVIAASLLYSQGRIKTPDLFLAMIDLTLGILFVVAFVKTGNMSGKTKSAAA
jgi:hypothetical protein